MTWGLALSGGGLLGAAHLGVWQALEEMGLRAPIVAGTSAGGLVAGLYALGVPASAATEAGRRVSRAPLEYFHPALRGLWHELLHHGAPASGLFHPQSFVQALLHLSPGSRGTADWRLPAAVTAVDLVTLRPTAFVSAPVAPPPGGSWRVLPDAPLSLALHATMAVPGVFTAAETGGHVYVDGGLADDLPEDWAAALGAERVLAVRVAPPAPSAPTQMGLPEVLARCISFVTGDTTLLRRTEHPVMRITPDTQGVPFFAFSRYDELVQAGYAAARAQSAAIRRFVDGGD